MSANTLFTDLSSETVSIILKLLDIGDIQNLVSTCKAFRQLVLSSPCKVETIAPTEKQSYSFVQKTMTDTLLITSPNMNVAKLKTSLNFFKNATVLKIARDFSQYIIKSIVPVINISNIIKVFVADNQYIRWLRIIKNYDAKFRVILWKNDTYSNLLENPLLNGVSNKIIPTPNDQEWRHVINNFNTYRKKSINQLKNNTKLRSPQEALSLNNIMLFSTDNYLEYDINLIEWEVAVEKSRSSFQIASGLSKEDTISIRDILDEFSEYCSHKINRLEDKLKSYKNLSLLQEGPGKIAINMMENIHKKAHFNWSISELNESSYEIELIDPILTAFINVNLFPNLTYHSSSHTLYESKSRKLTQQSADTIGRKPDRSLEVNNTNQHVFLCEIKTEKHCKNRPDLVKLGSMMKDCLDTAIEKGVDYKKYSITGLLIEGRTATLYCMDLLSPKFYRMIEVTVFFLPTTNKDMCTLYNVFNGMMNCKQLIEKTLEACINNNNSSSIDTESFLVPSCSSPKHHVSYYSN